MIIGTAGHIDHGKTSLVKRLTGVDTDRLPEEQRRGITIELGYAYCDTPNGQRLGFVDVPGHEKLVRTMVAGATGIDCALLLMAADDGVMPQTKEHALILSLLGVAYGVLVITKADRVDAATIEIRRDEARALLSRYHREQWDVVVVSSHTGLGIDELRQRIDQIALVVKASQENRPLTKQSEMQNGASEPNELNHTEHLPLGFRMPIDRAFTLNGVGTVLAGCISTGHVNQGDSFCFADKAEERFRVRSLRVHDQSSEVAKAGQRAALGLVGLERGNVKRGQVLCDPAIAQTSERIDVVLKVAASESLALRSGSHVHLHLGCDDLTATVAILGANSIAPGAEGLAQLVIQRPMACWQHDRLILRDASAQRTIAGGIVLDSQGLVRYRQTNERLAWLEAQKSADVLARLAQSLKAAPAGFDLQRWLQNVALKKLPVALESSRLAVNESGRFWIDGSGTWIIAQTSLEQLELSTCDVLKRFHGEHPEEIGPDLSRLRRAVAPAMTSIQWGRLCAAFVERQKIFKRGAFLQLPSHAEQLHEAERVVAQRVIPLLLEGRFDPPWVRDLSGTTGHAEVKVRSVLARLAKAGDVFQVVKDLYYNPVVVQQLASLARDIEAAHGEITAASFRDATGLGRKRAIQILEFFDRIGFLRRIGDVHRVQPGSKMFLTDNSGRSP